MASGPYGRFPDETGVKKIEYKVPGATPFQDKLKEYELKAPTVGMFGEISKDGESILEIAAWKRADEYCTFFASKPQVALSRIKQQMHREVGHSSMLHIVRNIRGNMEFLELPGGGTHQPFSDARRGGRTPFFSLAGENHPLGGHTGSRSLDE